MQTRLIVEEEKSDLAQILIVDTNSGIQNKLLDLLAISLEGKLKVYVLTKKSVSKDLTVISPLSIHFLDKLSESLRLAVIFLDEESQKKKVIEIIDKLEVHNSQILILIPYRIAERFIDVIISLKDRKNISIGLAGDLFGESHLSSPVSKIIENAIKNKNVEISGNELLPIFPISEKDMVNSIHYILFSKKKNFLYSLFYKHPQTLLSLTHLLKRIEPELSINFKEGNSEARLLQKTQEQKDRYLLDRTGVSAEKLENYIGFEKSVETLQHKFPKDTKINRVVSKKEKIKKQAGTAGKVFRYLIYGFALYLLISFTLFFVSLIFFKIGVSDAARGDFKIADQNLKTAKNLYDSSKITTEAVASVPMLFSNTYLFDYLKVYERVLDDAPVLLDTLRRMDNKSLEKEQLEKSFASLFELYFLTQKYNLQQFYQTLKIDDPEALSRFVLIANVLPQVLGFDAPKSYILLFQNSNELRPTGGFIGSVSYVTVKNGKVDDIKINDVYDLDGQIKGHVESHFIIRRYLQPHLYLRDSNFSPNFEESASMSALLYNLETGKRADGVIAIDTKVLEELIKITGPFNIPGEKEINSSNVIDIVQDSIKENFFPGSTNKKDILNAILNKIITTIEDPKKRVEVFKILPNLISEKHILFAFSTNSINKAFSAAGFTGNLTDNRIGKNVLKDIFGVNEANIGINKANKFINRKVNYSAYLTGSKLESEITLNYENKGGEDYKTYLRIIVPNSSELSSIVINNKIQEIVPAVTDFKIYERKSFEPPSGLEVDEEIKNDKRVIGFIVNVPKRGKLQVKIKTANSNIIPNNGSFNYSLLYIKQPGTDEYPLTVSLQTDGSYKTENKYPVIFDSKIKTDEEVTTKALRKEPL